MTTICTDGISMACDGQVCFGDTITAKDFIKIQRLPDGRIVGCAGSAYSAIAFRDWLSLEDHSQEPVLHESFEAIVLLPGGMVISYNDKCQSISEPPVSAIGSGAQFALAALDAGRTPEEAIAIAIGRDSKSGGLITVIHSNESDCN